MSDPPKRVHVSYRGTDNPRAAREAVFTAAYEALTGHLAEEFHAPIRSHAYIEGSARDHCGWTDPNAPRTMMSACGQHRDRHITQAISGDA
jgi:hypothetical protein